MAKDPYLAVEKMLALLRGIKGAGYYNQLTEAYPTLLLPEEEKASLPYACLYFDQGDGFRFDGDWGTTLIIVLRMTLSLFMTGQVATEAIDDVALWEAKLAGDLAKAFLLDVQGGDQLAGSVDDFSLGNFEVVAGLLPGEYGEATGSVTLKIITGPDGLGP